jgi:hypothetical protein
MAPFPRADCLVSVQHVQALRRLSEGGLLHCEMCSSKAAVCILQRRLTRDAESHLGAVFCIERTLAFARLLPVPLVSTSAELFPQ